MQKNTLTNAVAPITAFSLTALMTAGLLWLRLKIKKQVANNSLLEMEYNF